MTDPGPRFLPGQNPVAKVPYGMENGPVALAGINDQPGQRFGGPPPVQPDKIDLDAPLPQIPPTPAPGEPTSGWRFKDKTGKVLATFASDPQTGDNVQKVAVQKIGDALTSQAVSPEEHAAAARATAYGLSLVGTDSTPNIQKAIAASYDRDMGNSTKLQLQGMRSRKRSGGPGAPAHAANDPYAPTKENKFKAELDDKARGTIDKVVAREQSNEGYKAITALDQTVGEIEALLNSGRGMSERVAVQQLLLQLTGKASRESEQAAITGAAGKWNEFQNKLSQWTSDNPTLTRAYINEFKKMTAAQRAYVAGARDKMGRKAAADVHSELSSYPDEARTAAADSAYGNMTGRYASEYKPPHERNAAPQPATPAGKGQVDDDLMK